MNVACLCLDRSLQSPVLLSAQIVHFFDLVLQKAVGVRCQSLVPSWSTSLRKGGALAGIPAHCYPCQVERHSLEGEGKRINLNNNEIQPESSA